MIQPAKASRIALAAAALSVAPTLHAEVITTAAHGDDWTIHRTDATSENRVLVKNSSNNGNDRVGVAQFNSFTFAEAVTTASVRLDIERTAGSNNFLAGESISLWGVIDGHASENITQSVAWSTNPFITDDAGDGTDNNLTDSELVFLGSITFGSATSGDVLDFAGPAVTSFVQNDSNGLMTFLLATAPGMSDANTVLLYNADSSVIATESYPSVLTNADAVVPEPASLALLGPGTLLVARRRR